jgi:small subunit ribosomal protein S6
MPQPLPKHRAREYETIFILNPEISTDDMEQIAGRLTDVIDRLDGKLLQAENWGRRRLSYPVRKFPKAFYIYLRYLGYSDMVAEMERNMRMLEPVLKYLTVKLDEDVDPTARPVNEEEISFLPRVDEYGDRDSGSRTRSPAKSDEPVKTEAEAAPEKAAEAAPEKAAEAAPEKAAEAKPEEDKTAETDEPTDSAEKAEE